MATDEFDLSLLSLRENEILKFAADGLTDIQIALRLDIRPGTVNSYWVRIRSKLGHRSRTELVAMALRKQAADETAELRLRSERWEQLAAEREGLSKSALLAETLRGGMNALPDAVTLVSEHGVILFANSQFSALFGYESEELHGMRAMALIPGPERRRLRGIWSDLIQHPTSVELGFDGTFRAQRKDRSAFPACARLGFWKTTKGLIAACVVLPI